MKHGFDGKNKKAKNKRPILADFIQVVSSKTGDAKYSVNLKGDISMSDAVLQFIEHTGKTLLIFNPFAPW